MRTPIEEQETIIRIDRVSDTAEIYTSDTRYMNKFDKLVESSPEWEFEQQTYCEGDVVGKFYKCPVNFISFRTKTVKKDLTDEQRAALADRAKRVLHDDKN